MKIYVASSWRNRYQPAAVEQLRHGGHAVYDFRNPAEGKAGFSWSEIDPGWQNWTPSQYLKALGHPIAARGFALDMYALSAAEACVLVLPCGRSAHLELGHAAGRGLVTAVLMLEPAEPELMYRMVDGVFLSLEALAFFLEQGAAAIRADRLKP